MKEIVRIVIKGSSGYCPADQAYEDKVTISGDLISYAYKPLFESGKNFPRNWRYKTDSPVFRKHFYELVSVMPGVMEHSTEMFCTDIGGIEFIVTFDDKTRWQQIFWLPGDEFRESFNIIRKMIPACETILNVLLLSEDFEERRVER